jgi:putative NADH-flavin reductase
MRLVLFGATGRTGRLVVEEALHRGHEVVAVSRHPPEGDRPGLSWRQGDVLVAGDVEGALARAHAEAVIVCLGAAGPDDVSCGEGTAHVVSAARAAGVDRIACLTGAMIGHAPERMGWVLRRLRAAFRSSLPEQAADRDAQEEAVRRSRLRYTVVRPARLTDGGRSAALVAAEPFVPSLAAAHRRDVAALLVDAVERGGCADRGERELVVLSRPPLGVVFLAAWVAAFALGELVALGTIGAIASAQPGGGLWVAALLAVAAGLFEGAVVGTLLAAVLGRVRPEVSGRQWVHATMAGAVVGWGLGSIPALLLSSQAPAAAEPPAWLAIAGAAALGAVAGPVLALFQGPVLRPIGVRQSTWLVANALGWSLAMPAIFRAAAGSWSSAGAATRGAAWLILGGAAVGLVTGLALVRAARARVVTGVAGTA